MMDTTRAQNISCNIGRAAQHEIEGDSKSELRFLLFAAQDIAEILEAFHNGRMDTPTAKWHAVQLDRISKRIRELIEDGI